MSKVTILVCNTKLQVEMLWLSIISRVDKLHTYWRTNKISLSDTIMKGFNTLFKKFCKKNTDPIFLISKIDLSFPASKEIKIKRVEDCTGARILCVFLTALESSEYEDHNKDDNFDII